MNDELELLFSKDVPVVPEVDFDYKKMLQNCKTGKEKHNIKLFKHILYACFCLVLCFISALATVLILNNKSPIRYANPANVDKEKIDVIKYESTIGDISDDNIPNPDNPNEQIIEWYGIEINIRCDYSKHPKYKEWEEEFYNGNYQTDPYDTRPLDYHLINFLHKKIYEYESMDVLFSNQQTHSFWPGSQIINIDYIAKKGNSETIEEAVLNMEEYLKDFYETDDYNNLLELANKDYITKIVIIERWPRINGDEQGDLII